MVSQTQDGLAEGLSTQILYKAGGVAFFLAVLVALSEIAIQFLPGVSEATQHLETVTDWFRLFEEHWFLGLRSLGLLNLIGAAVLTPAVLALYFALRREGEAWAALGAVLFFVGMAVYFASNRGFAMWALSGQWASAASDAQRAMAEAAGQAMLVEGSNRLGLALIDAAGVVFSAVMLSGRVFGRATAFAGIVGNGLMIVFESVMAFVANGRGIGMRIVMLAGICLMAWYLLAGARLLRMGAGQTAADNSALRD